MGAHFPAVELDNVIWFSTLSRISGFLWHYHNWALCFSHFLHYASGIEVNYVAPTTTLTMWLPCSNCTLPWTTKFLGVFSKTYTMSLQHHSLLDTRPSAEFSGKIHKILRSLAEYLAALGFLCCHYIFDSYITILPAWLFNTICILLFSFCVCAFYSLEQWLFWPHSNLFSVNLDALDAHFSVDYIHAWDHVWYLHKGHPIKENQQCISIFLKKQTCLKNEWRTFLHN